MKKKTDIKTVDTKTDDIKQADIKPADIKAADMQTTDEKTVDMKVNPLPSITWHWLKMNDSDLNIAMPDVPPVLTLGGENRELRWINGLKLGAYRSMGRANDTFVWPGWSEMETGMGDEFAQALRSAPTAFLDIPNRYDNEKPAVIAVTAPEGQAAGQILIHAGAGSNASVILDMGGCDKTACDTMALQLLMHVEADARLRLFVVQTLAMRAVSCINIGGVCEERAGTYLTQVSLGSQKAYIGIAMKLNGDESTFQGDMGYRVKPGQDVDINYVARHIGSRSVSGMNAWAVLEEGSRKLFRGTIDFNRGCPGSKGAEKEDVLLLGEHQVNQTIPLILCHEEDVEGDHGATISRLDDQILFYLGTRGVDPDTAEEMIAQARIEALISRIPDEDIRHAAEEMAVPEGRTSLLSPEADMEYSSVEGDADR